MDDLSTIGNEFSVGHLVCSHSLEKSRMELDRATAASERYLSRWEETTLTALLKSCAVYGICFLPGVGRRWSHVGIGGLIVKESDHFHAKGMSSATFRRGPFEMLSPETFVLVFAGHESTRALNAGLVRDIIEGQWLSPALCRSLTASS